MKHPSPLRNALFLFRFGLSLGLLAGSFRASPASAQQGEFPPQHPPARLLAQRLHALVPDLRGQTPESAQSILAKAGLVLGTRTVAAGPGAAGTVWDQRPAPNSRVAFGTGVNVRVVPVAHPQVPTHGDEEFRRLVPALHGKSPEQARDALSRIGLKLGNVAVGTGTGTEGTIFWQEPAAGQWVQALSSVNVKLVPRSTADGPREFPWRVVPSLRGLTAADAEQTLRRAGLRIGSVNTGAASVAIGTVFEQEPQANARVRAGSAVNIRIARATPPTVATVPNLLHLDSETALGTLRRSRLSMGGVQHEEGDRFIGLIVAQSPEAGTRVEPGTAVNVTLAIERPLVIVPDLLKRDEASASAALAAAGLTMGGVTETDSEESSGTVLSQKPPSGARVRQGSAVDLSVSHEIVRTLDIMTDDPSPEIGKPARFHAHLSPEDGGFQYRFDFGDGSTSKWTPEPIGRHSYPTAGHYEVRAIAARGAMEVRSQIAEVVTREAEFTLTLKADPQRIMTARDVTLVASVNRKDLRPTYQFVFEDGSESSWSPTPSVHRRYAKWGTYLVKVRARVGKGRITESRTDLSVGPSLSSLAGLALGVVALGGAGLLYSGWKNFSRWVRAVSGIDTGRQDIDIPKPEGWGEVAHIRLVNPPGAQHLAWTREPQEGGADG